MISLRDGWDTAKRQPWIAAGAIFTSITLCLCVFLVIKMADIVNRQEQEEEDRIQMACTVSFANGQALLDTVTDVDPQTVEDYRRNLQRRTTEAIHDFDPDFNCQIPPPTEE